MTSLSSFRGSKEKDDGHRRKKNQSLKGTNEWWVFMKMVDIDDDDDQDFGCLP